MTRPSWAPEGIDINKPTAARAYDYVLGGVHNFEVDRELARKLMAATPDLAVHARANRAFLQRAVRHLTNAGIRQFIDIGSGIPAVGNVHEEAQKIAPESRVVYVDIDPVAVAHSRSILAEVERCAIIQEDVRDLSKILGHPETQRLINFDQPVAVLLLAVLHAIPDADNPGDILAKLREALAPGSYLVVSHASHDVRPDEARKMEHLSKDSPTALNIRAKSDIAQLFDGFDLIEPGLTWVSQWRPEADGGTDGEKSDILLAGVAVKP